jgi:hypothetical protein
MTAVTSTLKPKPEIVALSRDDVRAVLRATEERVGDMPPGLKISCDVLRAALLKRGWRKAVLEASDLQQALKLGVSITLIK